MECGCPVPTTAEVRAFWTALSELDNVRFTMDNGTSSSREEPQQNRGSDEPEIMHCTTFLPSLHSALVSELNLTTFASKQDIQFCNNSLIFFESFANSEFAVFSCVGMCVGRCAVSRSRLALSPSVTCCHESRVTVRHDTRVFRVCAYISSKNDKNPQATRSYDTRPQDSVSHHDTGFRSISTRQP